MTSKSMPVAVGQVREATQAAEVRQRGTIRPDAVKVLHVDGEWSNIQRAGGKRSVWMKTENVAKRFPVVVTEVVS